MGGVGPKASPHSLLMILVAASSAYQVLRSGCGLISSYRSLGGAAAKLINP